MLDFSWGHLNWYSSQLLSWRHVRWSAHIVLFLFSEVLGRHVWCIPFCLAELKFLVSLQLILVFGESCLTGRQTQFGFISDPSFGSVVIVLNQFNFAFGFFRIVWWVDIHIWSAWWRSYVNLEAEIVCWSQSSVGFFDIRLRFEKSSPRWRM